VICDHAIPGTATTGALGFDDLKWLKPVRPGDVLSVETRVLEKIESPSRHGVGTVKIESRVLNQRDEAVVTLSSLVLYQRRATV
jgi:acyl dehydratase